MPTEVRTILDTLPASEPRQVRGTMAGAHLAPLADAQIRAIRAAAERPDRTVYTGQASRPTLKALARKGLGTLNFQPGLGRRQVIESLTLNARGMALDDYRSLAHQQPNPTHTGGTMPKARNDSGQPLEVNR